MLRVTKFLALALAAVVLLAAKPDKRAAGIAHIKRASDLQATGAFAAAIREYDRAASNLPQISDWIAIYAASAAAQNGDTAQVARRLKSVDDELARDWGWRIRARAFERIGMRARAIEYATAVTESGSATRRAEAWHRIAGLQKDQGYAVAQRNALLMAMQAAPASEPGMDAARELTRISDLSPAEHMQVGRTLLRNNDAKRAVRELALAIESGQIDQKELSATKYDLARAKYRTGERDEGRRMMNEIIVQHPTSAAATRALFFLADLAQDAGETDEAFQLYERAAEGASAEETPRALMRLGGIAFGKREYPKAIRIFAEYAERYPSGYYHDQATYWLALSRIAAGDTVVSRELLRSVASATPVSYYGVRSAEVLGKSPLATELAASPVTMAATKTHVRAGLDRWQLLRDVGWDNTASYELSRVRLRYKEDRSALYTLAEELSAHGAPHIGITIGRELANEAGKWDRRLLEITYPMPYEKLIVRESRARGLDPYFVAALIRQESKFNRKAVSGAGAVGLMQVMPATGKALRKKANVKRITRARLTEAEANIKLGTKFLSDMIGMYGKRLDVVLVAYNAGPGRADRWRKFPEFGTEDLFVERIPFDETREYVKIVKVNAAIYRALYGDAVTGD